MPDTAEIGPFRAAPCGPCLRVIGPGQKIVALRATRQRAEALAEYLNRACPEAGDPGWGRLLADIWRVPGDCGCAAERTEEHG